MKASELKPGMVFYLSYETKLIIFVDFSHTKWGMVKVNWSYFNGTRVIRTSTGPNYIINGELTYDSTI